MIMGQSSSVSTGIRLRGAVIRRSVGTDEDELLVSQHLELETGLLGLVLEHGEVELAGLELLDQLRLVARFQMHARIGHLSLETGDEAGQQGRRHR